MKPEIGLEHYLHLQILDQMLTKKLWNDLIASVHRRLNQMVLER